MFEMKPSLMLYNTARLDRAKMRHLFVSILITSFVIQVVYLIVTATERESVNRIKSVNARRDLKRFTLERNHLEHARNVGKPSTTKNNQSMRARPCSNCVNTNFSLLLEPKGLCENKLIRLVIIIMSISPEKHTRDVIRQTWLSETQNQTTAVCYYFLLGKPDNNSYYQDIKSENDERNDMVVYDFVDSYQNLTFKTILGFKYATKRFPDVKFVMKTDSDVYVNLRAILSLLSDSSEEYSHASGKQSYPNDERYKRNAKTTESNGMFGRLLKNTVPVRERSRRYAKWFVTKREFPDEKYPDYFDGQAYILPMNIARKIVNIARNIPFFKFEDVFVGLCLKELGYTLRTTHGFFRFPSQMTLCSHKYEYVFTVHDGITSDIMQKIWNATCPVTGVMKLEIMDRLIKGMEHKSHSILIANKVML